jgi:hypothetical protein
VGEFPFPAPSPLCRGERIKVRGSSFSDAQGGKSDGDGDRVDLGRTREGSEGGQ